MSAAALHGLRPFSLLARPNGCSGCICNIPASHAFKESRGSVEWSSASRRQLHSTGSQSKSPFGSCYGSSSRSLDRSDIRSTSLARDSPSQIRPFSRSHRLAADVQESATARADLTKRRFWNKVTLSVPKSSKSSEFQAGESYLTIELDGRPLKTPSGALLIVPKDRPLLASLVAREWSEQERVLKSFTLPLTSLAARAIDGFASQQEREKVCDTLIKYLETDTVCYQEEEPPVLVKLQKEHWDPLISWVSETFGVSVHPITSLLGSSQPTATTSALRAHISSYDALELAAFERAVMATKSFIIALKLLETSRQAQREQGEEQGEEWGVEEAAQAAEVEVKSQTEKWGEVEDTHDVDHEDLRARLGSVVLGLVKDDPTVADRILEAQRTAA